MTKFNCLCEKVCKSGKNLTTDTKLDLEQIAKDGADYETAIEATGYGKFHYILFFVAIISAFSVQFESSSMSYVFPAAQCDLSLSLGNKGLLNAMSYLGSTTTVCLWGFLADTIGRRKVAIIAYLIDALIVVSSAFAQSFELLVVAKFFGGTMIYGGHTAFICYLSEFQTARNRTRTQLMLGFVFGTGNILLPLLAWGVLPTNIYIPIQDSFVIHSWNIFILLCGLPSLISCITYTLLPESPKYFMSVGRNKDALKVFQKVYSCNTGKSSDRYPIKKLIVDPVSNSKAGTDRSTLQAVKEGFSQIKPIFSKLYIGHLLLINFLQISFIMCINTIRLWLPQIFQAINEYKVANNGSSSSMCDMLLYLQPSFNNVTSDECQVNFDGSVYQNSMIIAAVQISGYVIISSSINSFRKKLLVAFLAAASGICLMCVYVAQNVPTVLTLISVFLLFSNICTDITTTIVIDVFPTALRGMALAITIMLSRFGAVIGNIIFPILLSTGCAAPFFLLGSFLLGCAIMSSFLPKTDLAPLK